MPYRSAGSCLMHKNGEAYSTAQYFSQLLVSGLENGRSIGDRMFMDAELTLNSVKVIGVYMANLLQQIP
ncbi:hypothetical protein FKM82_016637 [Ascaphus truei]